MVSHWTPVCLSVCQLYVHPSLFHFQMITWGNGNGFSPNLVCSLKSGLGLLMGKFRQILTELSARDIFSTNNFSKCQGILTKLGTCIDIKEIWFWNANRQISSVFDRVICPRHDNGGVLSFYIFINKQGSLNLLVWSYECLISILEGVSM